MPPPPPPAPGPPPKLTGVSMPAAQPGRDKLLASIHQGKKLKRVPQSQINDRSGLNVGNETISIGGPSTPRGSGSTSAGTKPRMPPSVPTGGHKPTPALPHKQPQAVPPPSVASTRVSRPLSVGGGPQSSSRPVVPSPGRPSATPPSSAVRSSKPSPAPPQPPPPKASTPATRPGLPSPMINGKGPSSAPPPLPPSRGSAPPSKCSAGNGPPPALPPQRVALNGSAPGNRRF